MILRAAEFTNLTAAFQGQLPLFWLPFDDTLPPFPARKMQP